MPSELQYNEKELLTRLAAGEEPAFRQLFGQYKQRIYSFAFFLTRSESLAEEITQEIFIKIWINREKFTEINYFASWLRTLVRNQAYTYLRRIAHEKLILHEISLGMAHDSLSTETDVTDREYGRLLHQAIEQLPPQQKKVYLLSRKDGLKHKAIAAEMDISVNTVKNHLKAALKSIRSFLDSHTDSLVLIAMALIFKE